jgi:hypothetical protein
MQSKILGFVALAIIIGVIVVLFYPEEEIRHPAGIICPEAPTQTLISDPKPFLKDEYMVTPLANFSLHGKVLSREDYSWGHVSELSPIDLAIGWMEMSDQIIIDRLDISQSSRWYKWKPRSALPIPRRSIEQNSANMHMIPATDAIHALLDDVVKGQVIKLEGYLVKVTRDGNWHWNSSLSRDDTGDGACELIYVEKLILES